MRSRQTDRHRFLHPVWVAAVLVGLILLGWWLFVPAGDDENANGSRSRGLGSGLSKEVPGIMSGTNPLTPEYPAPWRSSLQEADESSVAVPFVVPTDADANQDNLTDVWMPRDGSRVILDFKSPGPTNPPIRQEYIEIYFGRWSLGDPSELYLQSVQDKPENKRIIRIDGITALVNEPRSPHDLEQANPAFLRMVVGGNLEVQISGGDNIERIIRIAENVAEHLPSKS